MAILTGINTRMRGSAGDWTFARINGQTVAKQKVEKKATPVRSYRQQRRRMQWKNILNLYCAFSGKDHPSFEAKEERLSDYNMFMRSNLDSSPVYLTKDEARQGGCVVAPYQVTRGSLPSIVVSGEAGQPKCTDITLGATFTITAGTTVKQFSDQVIQANPERFMDGDKITCFIAAQHVNAVTNVPYVTIKAEQIQLDQSDSTTLLRALVSTAGFSVVDGKLGAGATVNGGICWVHSRATQSGTKVSTQRFEVANTSLTTYQSAAQLSAAIESYGGINKEAYLTPDTGDQELPDPGF